ncbi:MAG: hypothetical protein ACK5OV_01620, partial [bacterium]
MAAFNCHERRAEAVHTARILVARRLVNLPLSAKIGFERMDGQAIGLLGTIATTLTHGGVDV